MKTSPIEFEINDFDPSLREAVLGAEMKSGPFTVAFIAPEAKKLVIAERTVIPVSDGHKVAEWRTPSLRALFRGNAQPPADVLKFPEPYVPYFYFIERQLITICEIMGDRTDDEMNEVYSLLRRRPDGKSMGVLHDALWQVCALLLGTKVLSQAQYESIMNALEGSTRRWRTGQVSRFYLHYLRSMSGIE